MSGPFLPDRLRPTAQRRRKGRPLLVLLAVLAMLPAAAPWWRVQAVEVDGCQGLPETIGASLEDLVGRSPLMVDPQWVRRQVEVWPGVAAVDVSLELPATLRVKATPALSHGSVPSGNRWRSVTRGGRLAGPLDEPHHPVLVGFSNQPDELEAALAVARRLAAATGAVVEEVHTVTPVDFEVRLRRTPDTESVTVHVRPVETHGERYWCDRFARGEWTTTWADLRWEERVVVGGGR
jgi:hypothetical protein